MAAAARSRPWAASRAWASSLACAAVAFGACRSGPKNFDNENDALRREVAALKSDLGRLQAENSDLRAQTAQALAALKAAGSPGAAVIEAMPRCAAVEISSKTALARTGEPRIEVVIETLDARRRFVQVGGVLTIDATGLPEGPAGQPRALGAVTLSPEQLREAYRSSFMGTHYAVTLPLSAPAGGTIIVRARLDDAVTGQRFEATRTLRP